MIYAIDIDGTLCNHEEDYSKARPFPKRITMVNKLYDSGHRIILCTGRGGMTKMDWRKITEEQLSKWKVKYHELRFKQFYYDYWIDDRAMLAARFFTEVFERHYKQEPSVSFNTDYVYMNTPRMCS